MRRPDKIEQDTFLPYRHGARYESSLGQTPDAPILQRDSYRSSASQISLSSNASHMINKEKGSKNTGFSSAVKYSFMTRHRDIQPSGGRSLAILRVLAVGLAVSVAGPVCAMEIGRAHLDSAPVSPCD
ncbi:hypothetical protein [Orrella marina]|uniref:Uncharacterized protein n=1 Tax=Orrella marina TaxID=2163011 RepID=A0A2R4XH15_9BURK|nr:hypothetical protein [Orrella marina]AWB33102.1 hypothetical protein DBV39_04525 [Orrella marina]